MQVYGRFEDTVETLVLMLMDPVLKGSGDAWTSFKYIGFMICIV